MPKCTGLSLVNDVYEKRIYYYFPDSFLLLLRFTSILQKLNVMHHFPRKILVVIVNDG